MGGSSAPAGAPLRFLVAGGVNTLVTFAIYVALVQAFPYHVAYSAAFAIGIVLSYLLSRTYVFRARGTTATVALFPLVYILQYLLGLGVVTIWTDVLALPVELASAAAIVVSIPFTYLLLRRLFMGRRSSTERSPGA